MGENRAWEPSVKLAFFWFQMRRVPSVAALAALPPAELLQDRCKSEYHEAAQLVASAPASRVCWGCVEFSVVRLPMIHRQDGGTSRRARRGLDFLPSASAR